MASVFRRRAAGATTPGHRLPTDFGVAAADAYDAVPEVGVEREPRSFGDELRERRRGAGLNQAELAERAGISERAVSDIERGLRSSVYAATARRLADALAVDGDERRRFLLAAARPARASTAATATPLAMSPRYRARLPLPLTRLLGRDEDVAALGRLLREDATHIVTIVGPGGVGKSRLAVEVALRWQSAPSDAVHFVDLSPVSEAAAVLPAIAAALGLAVGEGDVITGLSAALAGQRALLVLDTLEHVLDSAADVADLASLSPWVTLLITSRSLLRVRGEHQWALSPLTVEPATAGTRAPAVQLFLERAREASPRLVEDAATVAVATEICARVDGLPLAIELAAARAGTLSPRELLRTLDDRLAPLTEGRRDSPARHHTMRAALDWSYAMLGEPARRTLRALSVFRGGATAAAIQAVAGCDHDSIDSLTIASLVAVDHAAAEPRYRVADLVAAYAAQRADEQDERDALQQAHGAHFLSLAQVAAPHIRGSAQREWFTRLLADEANLRAAMERTLHRRDARTALELAAALWMFWRWAGLFADARGWLDAALRLGAAPSALRLEVLWGAGWLALHQGDYDRMAEAGAEMLRIAGEDPLHRRNALTVSGTAQLAWESYDAAVAGLREALTLSESVSDDWVRATSMLNLGTALSAAGRHDEGEEQCRRALELYESIGDRHFAARARLQLAYTSVRRGDSADAVTHVAAALAVIRELGDMWSAAEGLEAAAMARAAERPHESVMLSAAAERIRGLIAMRAHPPDGRLNAARLQLARGQLGEAAAAEAWRRGHDAPVHAMLELATELVS